MLGAVESRDLLEGPFYTTQEGNTSTFFLNPILHTTSQWNSPAFTFFLQSQKALLNLTVLMVKENVD